MKKQLINWLWLGLLLPTFNLWAVEGDVWLSPATTTVALNTAFGLQVLVDSGTQKVGAYQVKLTYDATKLQVDNSTATSAINSGANALSTNAYNADVAGTLRIAGVDAMGKASGANLHLLTVNFKALATNGTASVALTVEQLTTEGGFTIGAATPRAGGGSTIVYGGTVDTMLTSGLTLNEQSVASGAWNYYSINVPSGATNLTVQTTNSTNSTADVDLYVLFNTKPMADQHDCSSEGPSGNETCSIDNPNAGTWWIGVLGYEYANYSITATVTTGAAYPDFVVTSLVLTPATPTGNGTFTAIATVKNQGTVAGDGRTLSVWANQATSQSCSASGDKAVAVGTLAAGATTTFTITGLAAGSAGTKTLRTYVDSGCSTVETNESNNQMTKAYTVAGGATAPIATTNAVTAITATSATLNGSVTSAGAIATVSFDFGTTTTYGASITATPSSVYSASAVAVTASKTDLTCGTTYHYRVKAVNSTGTSNGADKTFVTTACIYTVTPSAGTGGSVSPNTAQTVTGGTKVNFTVTPNTGYTRNSAVGGTCPPGTWSGNVWTTGAIVANCSVSFGFTPIVNGVCGTANGGTFPVAPTTNLCSTGTVSGFSGSGPWNWSCAGSNGGTTANCSANIIVSQYTVTTSANPIAGGTISPTQLTVNSGATANFTVTANSGYTRNATVTGTCPTGTWNNNVWTTGPITANCNVIFGFTPITNVNAWLAPPTQNVLPDRKFTLAVIAKSNSMQIKSYEFETTFNLSMLAIDYGYVPSAGETCTTGICKGANALEAFDVSIDYNTTPGTGIINMIGLQGTTGPIGPGNDLQLVVIHFKSLNSFNSTTVNLKTIKLANTSGTSIGLGSLGATVNVTTGICGDADGNITVNIVDALAIARKLVNLPPPPTIEAVWADVDKDGRVGITDALQIARYSVGLVTPPEVCKIGQVL